MKKLLYKIGCFFDKYLDWHSCKVMENDGASNVGICKYCGTRCLQDSQGNWFDPEKFKF